MHRLHFRRNVPMSREHWRRTDTIPQMGAMGGCFAHLHIYEENARFVLCALLMLVYVALGALLFSHIERENELKEKEEHERVVQEFRFRFCNIDNNQTNECSTKLNELLRAHETFAMAGLLSERPKWDFGGAFYFAVTTVSCIGYGMTTPRTDLGRAAVVFYGFLGCSSCILLFNLFLERIVTLFAIVLRKYHKFKVRRRKLREQYVEKQKSVCRRLPKLIVNQGYESPTESDSSSTCISPTPWRPSLYKVFGCLLVISTAWLTITAVLYAHVEGWSYGKAVYFCFVSYATIGFGDVVASQQPNSTDFIYMYRTMNFICLSIGCCCAYSLFNVTSVVIRQLLNNIIKLLDVEWRLIAGVCPRFKKKPKRYYGLGLRPPSRRPSQALSELIEMSHKNIMPLGPPIGSGLISLKEFLCRNQQDLVLLQQQLIRSSTKERMIAKQASIEATTISARDVGPLAYLTQKFGDV